MLLLNVLITAFIIMLIVVGVPTTPEEWLLMGGLGAVGFIVLFRLRNMVADTVASLFIEGGQPKAGAAERMTDRAEGYFQQQEYDTALYEFEQALRRARGAHRPQLMLRLAETAVLAERTEEALRWWREALQQKRGLTNPERAGALFRMAEVLHERVGDSREAMKLLAQVCRDYPETKFARYAEERMHLLTRPPSRT